MYKKDYRKFWNEIKHRMNSKVKFPTKIEGVHGDVNIGSMLNYHYENMLNYHYENTL